MYSDILFALIVCMRDNRCTQILAVSIKVETLYAIQYKLRMMGIPIFGPLYIYGDNMLVIHNTSKPESTLKKKCNAIAYHVIHDSVVMRESLTGCIRSEDNSADLSIEVIIELKWKHLEALVLYDRYERVT